MKKKLGTEVDLGLEGGGAVSPSKQSGLPDCLDGDQPPPSFRPMSIVATVAHIYSSFSSPILSGRRLDVYHTFTHNGVLVRV